MSGAELNTTVLERDAEDVWQAGADTLAAMSKAIPTIENGSFSSIPHAQEAAKLYQAAKQALGDYIDGGAAEFLKFEHLLLKSVLTYMNAHDDTMANIDRVTKELES